MPIDDELAALLAPQSPDTPPQRPVTEYEEITIRSVSIGFSGGAQDMTLYPEDTIETDDHGNIRIQFQTMTGTNEFVAYAGHTQWHSIKEFPHRRVKGTLRPNPREVMRDFTSTQTRKPQIPQE